MVRKRPTRRQFEACDVTLVYACAAGVGVDVHSYALDILGRVEPYGNRISRASLGIRLELGILSEPSSRPWRLQTDCSRGQCTEDGVGSRGVQTVHGHFCENSIVAAGWGGASCRRRHACQNVGSRRHRIGVRAICSTSDSLCDVDGELHVKSR